VPTDTPTNTPIPTNTPVPTDTPTNTPVPTDTPTNTPIPTNTLVPTNTPEPVTLHVGDLDGSGSIVKKSWAASVTIMAHDGAHGVVAGASVTGAWSGAKVSGSGSCTTDANGRCTVSKNNIKLATTGVTFTVSSVTGSGCVYTAEANHDPDGDSDGTTITVLQ
jgi:uncharacterized protein